jgi:hypothetical protein
MIEIDGFVARHLDEVVGVRSRSPKSQSSIRSCQPKVPSPQCRGEIPYCRGGRIFVCIANVVLTLREFRILRQF